jgi:3-methyladenine DNA glycosylase AlkD
MGMTTSPGASSRRVARLIARLRRTGSPQRAAALRRFFKTGPGQYGEGDRFLGLTVPQVRALVAEYSDLTLAEVETLLESPWHEARLLALVVLVRQYRRAPAARRTAIYRLYLRRSDRINNWDLVDLSAPGIVGAHLLTRRRDVLARLARSPSVWERRIAMLATSRFIRDGQMTDTLALAEQLLGDRHDLIHKAIGWMLREVGKRDQGALRAFLNRHAAHMPRTALRYAIERLPAADRRRYLAIPRDQDSAPASGHAARGSHTHQPESA